MADYKRRLTPAEDLKQLNLQNIRLSVENRDLKAENAELKNVIARLNVRIHQLTKKAA